jgi:hypothetical protein
MSPGSECSIPKEKSAYDLAAVEMSSAGYSKRKV